MVTAHRHAHRTGPHRRAVPARADRARARWSGRSAGRLDHRGRRGRRRGAVPADRRLRPGSRWGAAISFAIGLIVANVPEGLLPTITLALAVGVRELARQRRGGQAAVRGGDTRLDHRRSAPTRPARSPRTGCASPGCGARRGARRHRRRRRPARRALLAAAAAACTTARPPTDAQPAGGGTRPSWRCCAWPPDLGVAVDPAGRDADRRARVPLRRPAQADVDRGRRTAARLVVHTKGAPETVLPLLHPAVDRATATEPLDDADRAELQPRWTATRPAGLRVLAVAPRALGRGAPARRPAQDAEPELTPARPGRDGRPAPARASPPRSRACHRRRHPHPRDHRRLRR